MKYYLIIFILFISFCLYSKKIVELKNGESIKCEIVSEENDILTVVSDTFGEMKISRSDIKLIKDLDERTGYRYDDPNHCSLLFMPSAETNPKGTWYISDYELLFMNVGYSPVDNLHISTGFLFPIVPEMLTEGPISLGAKYRTIGVPYEYNMSIMGSITMIPAESDVGLITYGTAYNYYLSPRSTANLYFGGLTTTETAGMESIFSFGLALTFRTSESSKFIVEYLNGGMFDNVETKGIMLFGLRFFGEKISADLAGVKFLDISGSDLWLFIPLLSLTYHF
jgi:hypothetical protein